VLKPHYDANRAAEEEDSSRGGQTLATLIVYLNDGGPDEPKLGDALLFFPADRDGNFDERLEHEGCPALDEKWIARIWYPKLGDALLFFPADRDGNFDERLEHEGCPALDEKWIARIWHAQPVLPPYGLTVAELTKL
ncbi:hypothetical protein B484DRAFT_391097, partial [Ochromonadaceae sp. CCMP2298]